MPSTQKFESGQHVKRPWSQSNASRDVQSRSLEGAPVGRVRNYSEKGIGHARLNVSRKVVAVQRTEAGGAQKRARTAWEPEEARKKYRGDSSARACIIVGQGEISAMELRKYEDTSPSPSYPQTPPNSPHIGNVKGALSNQEATFKLPEVLLTTKELREGREECQGGVTTSTEKVSAHTTRPLPPQSSIVSRQELPVDALSPAQPQTDSRLLIAHLLNGTSRAEDVKPSPPTTMETASSGQPATDTGLGKLQGEVPADCQPHVKRSYTSKKAFSKIASHPEASFRGQASGASELTLVRASDHKLASGPRSDRMPLEERAVAQKLAVVGKILILRSDAPGSMVMLSIDPLLSQNVPDFFRFYSQAAGAGEASVLYFSLPDVTWQRHEIQAICRGDFVAFEVLKRTIWNCFCTFLTRGPGSAFFRVMVTAPARQVADDTVTISRPTAGRNEFSAGPPTQNEHSNAGFPAVPTKNSTRKTLRPPPLQIAPAPQYRHALVEPAAVAYRQDKPVIETSLALQIVVRIQENEHYRFSRPYSKNVLLSEVRTVDFFAWFARCTGYDNPSGPPELKFTLKDAVPKPKHAKIKGGDEEHFQYMKENIRSHFERTKALMPDLIEFTILVTLPGWVVERPGDEW